MDRDKLKLLQFPGKEIKDTATDLIDRYINQPAAAAGYPDTGAAISAGAKAVTDFAIPDDNTDLAMTMLPVGKVAKGLKRMGLEYSEILKTLEKQIGNAKTVAEKEALVTEKEAVKQAMADKGSSLNYKDMENSRQTQRAIDEENAPAIDYSSFGLPKKLVDRAK